MWWRTGFFILWVSGLLSKSASPLRQSEPVTDVTGVVYALRVQSVSPLFPQNIETSHF
jgi:hypothetical protein